MSDRVLTMDEVLNSKVYVKPGGSVTFGSPKNYLQPFLDMTKDKVDNYRIKVADPVINAEQSGTRNIAYPRVMIEAKFGQLIPGFEGVVGLVYALDMQKPVLKTYTGFNVNGCINLCIFNADQVYQQELLGQHQLVYETAGKYIKNKNDEVVDFKETLTKLKETFLNELELNRTLGMLLRGSIGTRLGSTVIIKATKAFDDSSSQYYVKPDGKFLCSKFNIYNAVTQGITDSSDIVDRANKTIQLSKLLLN